MSLHIQNSSTGKTLVEQIKDTLTNLKTILDESPDAFWFQDMNSETFEPKCDDEFEEKNAELNACEKFWLMLDAKTAIKLVAEINEILTKVNPEDSFFIKVDSNLLIPQ